MIKGQETLITNTASSECRTASCVSVSEDSGEILFSSEVVAPENWEPGLRSEVEIFTRTGFSESERTYVYHYEGKKTSFV